MDDLINFLRARLGEDEVMARYSQGTGPWELGECVPADEPGVTDWAISSGGYVHTHSRGNFRASHIVRHQPARVLREVESKRKRIEHYRKVRELADPNRHPDQAYVLAQGVAEKSLMFDALPYDDHGDYREEWRP
ncbi:DUF6221 family protein [Nonomuraea rubra]